MGKWRNVVLVVAIAMLGVTAGCKGNKQMEEQVAAMQTKLDESQRQIQTLDAEVKKANFELSQIKGLVTKLGNMVVEVKATQDRQEAEAKARVSAPKAAKKPAVKPAPKKAAAKTRR